MQTTEMDSIARLPKPPQDRKGWPWDKACDPAMYRSRSEWPAFTLIIPNFNQGAYIEQTIRSVLLQNYPNLELIILDGASTDNSIEVIKRYEPWISYWVSEPDRGQSHAINKGLQKASGEFINWVNSDDWLAENALFEVASFFMENPGIDLLYGDCFLHYPGIKTDLYHAVDFEPVDFISRISIHQPSTFWRTRVLNTTGFLDESLHYCMDFDLWARMVFNFKSAHLPRVLANFRRYPDSKSSNFQDQSNIYREYRIVVSRILTSLVPGAADKLDRIGLNYNTERVTYPKINKNLPDHLKHKMIDRYILTCAIQEYNLHHVKRCNSLLRHCISRPLLKEVLLTGLKNNLHFRKVAHPYRKSKV